jgi:hypothetical protein
MRPRPDPTDDDPNSAPLELFENNTPRPHGHHGLTPTQEGVMNRTVFFNFLLMAVRDLSMQYPDRCTECVFWDWLLDQPGDIIGTAFYKFDVGVPFALNKRDVTSLDWAKLGFTQPSGPQLRWLAAVQRASRAGATWGAAVARADKVFPFVPLVVA